MSYAQDHHAWAQRVEQEQSRAGRFTGYYEGRKMGSSNPPDVLFSDLTKQYFKTTNSVAHDEMFNSMYNTQVGHF